MKKENGRLMVGLYWHCQTKSNFMSNSVHKHTDLLRRNLYIPNLMY